MPWKWGWTVYFSKPFSIRELLAQVKALKRRLRQSAPAAETGRRSFAAGDLRIDLNERKVFRQGCEIYLNLKEFDLLVLLVKNINVVLERGTIIEEIWGYDYCGNGRILDVYIHWLREKIGDNLADPAHIKTVRGIGYCFRAGKEAMDQC